jgi:hypothetical protein
LARRFGRLAVEGGFAADEDSFADRGY